VGVILFACLLVQQWVSRCDGGVDGRARDQRQTSARPAALTDQALPSLAITPTIVASIARNLPAVPVPPAGRQVAGKPDSSARAAGSATDPGRYAGVPTTQVLIEPPELADSPLRKRVAMTELDSIEPRVFVDRYLLDDDAATEFDSLASRNERAGRRSVEAEMIYYDSDDDFFGSNTEKGVLMRWRQETLNWGEFDAQLIFSDIEADFLGRRYRNDDLYFTFRQTNAPLENGWLMNNAAGHQRTLADPFLHSGYRIRLPTSLFLGFSMGVTTETSMGQWYMGKTGNNRGIAVPQFEENGGEILGGSWRQPLGDGLLVGAEVVNVKGQDFIRDHTSVLAAGSFADNEGAAQYDLHLLTDDDTNVGLWADSRNLLRSDVVLRYGAFYLEPELAWMDRPIVNDQYGAYVRADKRTFLYNYSIGFDYTKAGLASDSPFNAEYQSLFLNGNYRLSRKLSLGANGNLFLRDFRAMTDDNQVAWRLANFVNYRFTGGLGRLEVYASQLNSDFDLNRSDTYGARISYDWNMPQGYRLTTEALLEEQRRLNLDNSNQRISVLFRQNVTGDFSWGVNTSYFRDDNEVLNTTTGVGLNADARWQFLSDWYVSASYVRNQSSLDAAAGNLLGGETELQSDAVWLRVGYANTSGQPFQRFGRNTSSAGAGRIRGEVYYDENRDFIRQPGERPAAGVVVVIDGRYETRTDAQGRYEFEPVYPGSHRVSLITEDLPLPWGLDDEAPQSATVGVRQATDVDFPLVNLTGI